MSTGKVPASIHGRRSYGMETEDWQHLAMAYDTWNDHIASGTEIDPDLKEFVKDVFDSYGLWDYNNDEPNLGSYRQLIMNLC